MTLEFSAMLFCFPELTGRELDERFGRGVKLSLSADDWLVAGLRTLPCS